MHRSCAEFEQTAPVLFHAAWQAWNMSTAGEPPIHVTVPGSPEDPRSQADPDRVVLHRAPDLHPDDVVTLPGGLRVTSVARTLVDLAEELSRDELRATFQNARRRGLLDIDALGSSRSGVEWRPSLQMLDDVITEFSEDELGKRDREEPNDE
jgi:hypothetical protein